MTTYFCARPDPQRSQRRVARDSFGLMAGWRSDIQRLHLPAVVFHDALSCEFTDGLADHLLSFRRWPRRIRASTNDDRFYCYREYLLAHREIERVFMTDLFDVRILRNPFELVSDSHDLWVGSEPDLRKCLVRRYQQAYGEAGAEFLRGQPVLNAGILGGSRCKVLCLLDLMIEAFSRIDRKLNANMAVFNMCIHQSGMRYFTGPPLHSVFKAYEKSGDFYIKHK